MDRQRRRYLTLVAIALVWGAYLVLSQTVLK